MQGFKQFLMRGNVVDMAVGVVIGVAFGAVVAALGGSGTLTQTDDANLARIVEALKDAARKISRQLIKSGSAAGTS